MKLFLSSCLCLVLILLKTPLFAAEVKWHQLKSSNFIIYYKNVPEDFVETVSNSAEDELRNVTQDLGLARYQSWAVDGRGSIYIYDDEEDYIKTASEAPNWSHGVALVDSKIIRTYPAAAGFFDSILPHELGHIVLHEIVGMGANVPVWFDEGVAMYQEKARRLGAHKAVKAAIENGQFIPLTKLSDVQLYKDSPREAVELFYAESASIVNFLITEYGESHFNKFCRELKEKTPFEIALAKVYLRLKSLEDLNKKWVNFLSD